ncbi:MAG: SDR family NAD(P)-dependent oxidoreductase [Pseudomonadales bacterium]|nr:SDR family NAD(P)-dependent oxidoreductase [Pseudomonadales bacterium]
MLVTGACGTVGVELLRQLLTSSSYSPEEIIGIDNNESNLFFLDQEFLDDPRARFFVGDVRDIQGMRKRFEGIDVVFHTAALKHVILNERSPDEAVRTNVVGVQNVIDAALDNNVGRVIFTSSDKAVNPTSVMGTSKLMGERLMTAANSNKRNRSTVFASTRFGNVLGSSGSVFEIFKRQISQGGPLTLTDPEMTRFVMSISSAVRLVLNTAGLAKGGEVFITKMPVISIESLARVMTEVFAPVFGHDAETLSIEVIGSKPGEKLYEELMSDEETRRAIELEEYFVVLPAFRGIYHDIDYDYTSNVAGGVEKPYNSALEPRVSDEVLKSLLSEFELTGIRTEKPDSRYWPGDKEERS